MSFTGLLSNCWHYLSSVWYSMDSECFKYSIEQCYDRFAIRITIDDIMFVLTIYALFADSIRILEAHKDYDFIFDICNTICFVAFSAELLFLSWIKSTFYSFCPLQFDGYFLSFLFLLDLISIVSLFPDVSFISDGLGMTDISNSYVGNGPDPKIARILRLLRLVRLVRLYKLYEERFRRYREDHELQEMLDYGIVSPDEAEAQKALTDSRRSKLGMQLSASITQKVVGLVIILLVVLPALQWSQLDRSSQFAMESLHRYNIDQTLDTPSKLAALYSIANNTDQGSATKRFLLQLRVVPLVGGDGYWLNDQVLLDRIRGEFIYNITFKSTLVNSTSGLSTTYITSGVFTDVDVARDDALLLALLIIIVTILMIAGTLTITGDVKRLILRPIERMMSIIEAVAADPLSVQSENLQQLQDDDGVVEAINDDDEDNDAFAAGTGIHKQKSFRFGGKGNEYSLLDDTKDDDAENRFQPSSSGLMQLKRFSIDSKRQARIGDTIGENGSELNHSDKNTELKSVADGRLVDKRKEDDGSSDALLDGKDRQRPSLTTVVNDERVRRSKASATDRAGDYETKLLEKTIRKITALLRVGFGEAGANIISHNLSSYEKAVIDPLIPGVRVYAIFGFCDIHRFDEVNRKLHKEVLTFVNTIAEIVHEHVHGWGGQCNKNLGNAFVIVWRIGDEAAIMAANDVAIQSRKNKRGTLLTTSHGHMHSAGNNSPGPGIYNLTSPSNEIDRDSLLNDKSVSVRYSMIYGGTNRRMSAISGGVSAASFDQHDFPNTDNGMLGRHGTSGYKRNFKVDLRKVPGIDEIADQALAGFLKVIAEINRNKKVLVYRNDPRLIYEKEKRKKRLLRINNPHLRNRAKAHSSDMDSGVARYSEIESSVRRQSRMKELLSDKAPLGARESSVNSTQDLIPKKRQSMSEVGASALGAIKSVIPSFGAKSKSPDRPVHRKRTSAIEEVENEDYISEDENDGLCDAARMFASMDSGDAEEGPDDNADEEYFETEEEDVSSMPSVDISDSDEESSSSSGSSGSGIGSDDSMVDVDDLVEQDEVPAKTLKSKRGSIFLPELKDGASFAATLFGKVDSNPSTASKKKRSTKKKARNHSSSRQLSNESHQKRASFSFLSSSRDEYDPDAPSRGSIGSLGDLFGSDSSPSKSGKKKRSKRNKKAKKRTAEQPTTSESSQQSSPGDNSRTRRSMSMRLPAIFRTSLTDELVPSKATTYNGKDRTSDDLLEAGLIEQHHKSSEDVVQKAEDLTHHPMFRGSEKSEQPAGSPKGLLPLRSALVKSNSSGASISSRRRSLSHSPVPALRFKEVGSDGNDERKTDDVKLKTIFPKPSSAGRENLSPATSENAKVLYKEFKVRMGFGLHAGWAIEGAVGSLYKVDATYLSPHVNMAARLETASRQYGVPLLTSHFFHELLSDNVQKKCRKLDVVTVKGSEVPIGLFTYDCYQDQIFQDLHGDSGDAAWWDHTRVSNPADVAIEPGHMASPPTPLNKRKSNSGIFATAIRDGAMNVLRRTSILSSSTNVTDEVQSNTELEMTEVSNSEKLRARRRESLLEELDDQDSDADSSVESDLVVAASEPATRTASSRLFQPVSAEQSGLSSSDNSHKGSPVGPTEPADNVAAAAEDTDQPLSEKKKTLQAHLMNRINTYNWRNTKNKVLAALATTKKDTDRSSEVGRDSISKNLMTDFSELSSIRVDLSTEKHDVGSKSERNPSPTPSVKSSTEKDLASIRKLLQSHIQVKASTYTLRSTKDKLLGSIRSPSALEEDTPLRFGLRRSPSNNSVYNNSFTRKPPVAMLRTRMAPHPAAVAIHKLSTENSNPRMSLSPSVPLLKSVSLNTHLTSFLSANATDTNPLKPLIDAKSSPTASNSAPGRYSVTQLQASSREFMKRYPNAMMVMPTHDEQTKREVFTRDMDLLQLRSHLLMNNTDSNHSTVNITRRTSLDGGESEDLNVSTGDNNKFLMNFEKGVQAYVKGDWTAARVYLEKSNLLMTAYKQKLKLSSMSSHHKKLYSNNEQRPEGVVNDDHGPDAAELGDGPSLTLLAYMKSHDFHAPVDWIGYRPLTSK